MVSPIDIEKALSGIDHPASTEVVGALNKIEDREYEGPSGVSSAVFG
jgi:hypothetical protein